MSKRYAIVGTSGRSVSYIDAILDRHAAHAELVGFCDINQSRMDWHNARVKERHDAGPIPTYAASDFEKMLDEQRVDTAIVITTDSVHHEYIVRAMDAGRDVICEKPMTIDAPKAREIFEAIERTGRELRVTFNYRYAPICTQVREMIKGRAIGQPLAVQFQWMLNTAHGADYFRRWHATKANSGGLLVHKATHHFDLVNWWIDSYPELVYCLGDLKFYGKANAEARGERYDYERYTGSGHEETDPFALDLASEDGLKGLYLDAEQHDGYIRDRNVFGDHVDIEDTIALTARYRSGVVLSYCLLAYCPWEGMKVAVTGTKGRIEVSDLHGGHIIAGQSDEELAAEQGEGANQEVKVYPMFKPAYTVDLVAPEGGHGGGDNLLMDDILSPERGPDPLGRAASHVDGAASILMGIAANESIRTGQPILTDSLLKLPAKDAVGAV